MIESTNFFTLFYIMFCLGFVLQSREFIGVGLSPEQILSRWIPGEDIEFLQHHLVKSSLTLILHLTLPLIYLLCYSYLAIVSDEMFEDMTELLQIYPQFKYCLMLAVLLIVSSSTLVFYWSLNDWDNHPFVKKLRLNGADWKTVASDINTEFRRIDKLTISTSPLLKVVVTDNWIISVGQWPWSLKLAHKSRVQLELTSSVHLDLSPDADGVGGVQYLSVKVKSAGESFEIRVKSTDYRDLEQRLRGNIANLKNITIYKSVSERFIEVFRQHVEDNPRFDPENHEEIEPCIGCMAVEAEVKLIRRCDMNESQADQNCQNCYCRPMWCLTCLGKWFAMRQNQDRPDLWLSSKCPCPTCRNKFCILDVSLINSN